ncbi:hypothetical protein [Lentibacillus saliphilus]|uniref:hypothetical protein n=1 Tax=Lentibacillus saliphilus TaxID=2737028 RepID=UPI001C302354|nr:hypothetical protein [Lentibacillus saliphilus]
MKRAFIAVLIASLLITGGTIVSADATKSFNVEQANFETSTKVEEVNPEAVPAVVGVAFAAGVAYKLGTKAAGWAWDKVAGRWEMPQQHEYSTELDVIFD